LLISEAMCSFKLPDCRFDAIYTVAALLLQLEVTILKILPLSIILLLCTALLFWADFSEVSLVAQWHRELAALRGELALVGERWQRFLGEEKLAMVSGLEVAAEGLLYSRLTVLERENEELRQALGLQLRSPWKLTVVELLPSRPATLAAGWQQGLYEGTAVLGDGRLIGMVGEVGTNSSTLLTLDSPTTALGVRLLDCGQAGVLSCEDERLLIRYLSSRPLPKVGEVVITSGLGRLPAGLPVGTVAEVLWEPGMLSPLCYLVPPPDLNRLELVFVVDLAGSAAETEEE